MMSSSVGDSSSGVAVGGLISGIDTNSIVSGLTSFKQQKVTRLQKQSQDLQDTQQAFQSLVSQLGQLDSKAQSLMDIKQWNMYKSTSTATDNATLTGDENATTGSHDLIVSQLATSQKVCSSVFKNQGQALGLSGTISLGCSQSAQKLDPTSKSVNISIQNTDALSDIVKKINSPRI